MCINNEWRTNMTKTRNKHLDLGKIAPNMWSFFDVSTGCQVGPIYHTKIEALADLERYARDAGWY
jgi:hypothetical protein